MAAADCNSEEASKATIEPDNVDLHTKHPLEHKWTLWYFKNDKTKNWNDNLMTVASFDTAEDFWALYNHIQPASQLIPGCDYSLFKFGIGAKWEDEKNKNGGRWLLNLDKKDRQSQLDNIWLETLLCLIGEAFDEESDSVCGAVVNVRNQMDKLNIWTTKADDMETNVKIGRRLKERLKLPQKSILGYQSHAANASKTSSTVKNLYQV